MKETRLYGQVAKKESHKKSNLQFATSHVGDAANVKDVDLVRQDQN